MIARLAVWSVVGVAVTWALGYVLVHAALVLVIAGLVALAGRLRHRADA